VAAKLGRKRSKRGKEPTYISEPFPDLRPLSIPSHSSGVKRFTAQGILDQLDEDVVRWQNELQASDDDECDYGKKVGA